MQMLSISDSNSLFLPFSSSSSSFSCLPLSFSLVSSPYLFCSCFLSYFFSVPFLKSTCLPSLLSSPTSPSHFHSFFLSPFSSFCSFTSFTGSFLPVLFLHFLCHCSLSQSYILSLFHLSFYFLFTFALGAGPTDAIYIWFCCLSFLSVCGCGCGCVGVCACLNFGKCLRSQMHLLKLCTCHPS